MKKYFEVLTNCALFNDATSEDLVSMLRCLSAKDKFYKKNDFIFLEEDKADYVGIVITGSVCVIKEDYWGNRAILAKLEPGELFGETYALADVDSLPISVLATQDCEVILIDCKKIIRTCSNCCSFHSKLIDNLLKIIAYKNITLNQKIYHLVKRTTKEKLISYLSEQAAKYKSNVFKIPFNRQELADYLSVERSAMSHELSKLKAEGIIEFNKNEFILK
jgi:CRP-like cAMP-binding protein